MSVYVRRAIQDIVIKLSYRMFLHLMGATVWKSAIEYIEYIEHLQSGLATL